MSLLIVSGWGANCLRGFQAWKASWHLDDNSSSSRLLRASPRGAVVKNLTANARGARGAVLIRGLGRSSRGGNGNSHPVFLPGKFNGQRSLVDCSPWGHKESDMTEGVHVCARAHHTQRLLSIYSVLGAKNWLTWKDWRREEKGTTEDEMVGWHHRLNGHEFE